MDARGKFILFTLIVGAWLFSNLQDVIDAAKQGDYWLMLRQVLNLGVGVILVLMALFNEKL